MSADNQITGVTQIIRTVGVFLLGVGVAAVLFIMTVGLPGGASSLPVNPEAPPPPIDAPSLSRAEQQELGLLVADLTGPDHAAAVAALDSLRARGWLDDGVIAGLDLRAADLRDADLSGAYLWAVDLTGADLQNADLSGARLAEARLADADLRGATFNLETSFAGAHMAGANLEGADLRAMNLGVAFGEKPVDLSGANLRQANLGGVNLWGVNLAGADLLDAGLQGANLRDANLAGADLRGTQFNERTTLPDDSAWVEGTDLTRFTDPGHPDFWRSEDPESPAYDG